MGILQFAQNNMQQKLKKMTRKGVRSEKSLVFWPMRNPYVLFGLFGKYNYFSNV